MPVTVECEITPSKKRWLVMVISCAASALFILSVSLPLWFLMLPLLGLFIFRAIIASQIQPERIRFVAQEIHLWQNEQHSQWEWLGEGKLSSQFVEFDLVNAHEHQLQLRIWQDSLSDASWRALNMAFRVNQSHARQLALGE